MLARAEAGDELQTTVRVLVLLYLVHGCRYNKASTVHLGTSCVVMRRMKQRPARSAMYSERQGHALHLFLSHAQQYGRFIFYIAPAQVRQHSTRTDIHRPLVSIPMMCLVLVYEPHFYSMSQGWKQHDCLPIPGPICVTSYAKLSVVTLHVHLSQSVYDEPRPYFYSNGLVRPAWSLFPCPPSRSLPHAQSECHHFSGLAFTGASPPRHAGPA